MQITLKQAEITAAIAGYLQNVLGVSGVTPETLSVVYKQGRSDKNGMTAELEIEAPRYEKPAASTTSVLITGLSVALAESELGKGQSGATPTETTSVSDVKAPGAVPAVDAVEPVEVVPVPVTEPVSLTRDEPLADPVYDGERRSETREERIAELNDEVAQALAEDEQAEAAEASVTPVNEEPAAEAAKPLFG